MFLTLSLIPCILALIGGVLFVIAREQRHYDARRTAYVLTFPDNVEHEQVVQWFSSLGGLLKRPRLQLIGLETVTLEVITEETGITHRLIVPNRHASYIVSQLDSHLPGTHATPDDNPPRIWTQAKEYGTTDYRARLRVEKPEAVNRTILGSVPALEENEATLLQLVITGARPEKPPAEREQRQTQVPWWMLLLMGKPAPKTKYDKLSEHNFLTVIRTAARADGEKRGRYLLGMLHAALGSISNSQVRVRRQTSWRPSAVTRRANGAVSPFLFPAQFSATELAAVSGIPLRNPDVPGLPRARTRHMRADASIPKRGIVLARSTVPGKERPLALTPADFTTHLHLIGKTGTGKSTIFQNIASQIMQQGHGLICIEPKGDLNASILDLVPRERLSDVIFVDPTDATTPVGLNLLTGTSPSLVTSYLMGVFESLFGSGPLTGHVLRNTIYTVALHPGMTLYEVALALDDPEFRDEITRDIKDEQLQRFWTRYENLSRAEQSQSTEPVMRRLGPLLTPEFRGIFGQAGGLDMADAVASGKIILVNLAEGQIGEKNAALLGSLVVARLWQEIQARSNLPPEERTPFFLLADEFQRYVKLPTSFEDILAQARGYGLPCMLAHQDMDQIREIRSAVMVNARNKFILQTGARDAAEIAREIGLKEDDIKRLGKHEAILSLVHDNQLCPPATGYTMPPPTPVGMGNAARAASRGQYGTPIAQVEAEIEARRTRKIKPKRMRPRIGKEEA